MPPEHDEELSTLEKARENLYSQTPHAPGAPIKLESTSRTFPHAWAESTIAKLPMISRIGPRHTRFAAVFFGAAVTFFILALAVAGALFYFGGNTVSVNNVTIAIQGPTTVAGGDTVPLSLAITNRNPVPIQNATIEIDFPTGTRSATNVLTSYPRYVEDLGTIPSGETVTRSVSAVVFGGAGQNLALPTSLSFGTQGSNAVFVKKATYALAISSTPLSISVNTLSQTVSGQVLNLTLTVRSNASVPLSNVLVSASLPFGFTVSNSSVPLTNGSFELGTLAPGATQTITLTGILAGQIGEQHAFNFTVGTGSSSNNSMIAIPYMSQGATVAIAAPFIDAELTLNGNPISNAAVSPSATQNVSLTYSNTLTTAVTNAEIDVTLSGSAIDFNSIQTTNGFYRSSDHTIVFSQDTDPALASLAPGATGLGSFEFSTLPPSSSGLSPQVSFTVSVSGTRVGETNVPEQVTAATTYVSKVTTAVGLSTQTLHTSGPLTNSGPIPPQPNTPTTYTVQWNVSNPGNPIGGGTVTATLPSYVAYTGQTSGDGTFSYDPSSSTVTWNIGDINQNASAQGEFQVSFTPSSSQSGTTPTITNAASFTGFDRFASVQVSASTNPATIETPSDPHYVSADGTVQ